jgi:hypothetical protein
MLRLTAGPQKTRTTPSRLWWNHTFLSDEICIGDSGDFDDFSAEFLTVGGETPKKVKKSAINRLGIYAGDHEWQ